jgi:hypothetical protein
MRFLRWAVNVTGIRQAAISYRIVVGNKGLERTRRVWADGPRLKTDGKETGCDRCEVNRTRPGPCPIVGFRISCVSSPMSELVWHILAHFVSTLKCSR